MAWLLLIATWVWVFLVSSNPNMSAWDYSQPLEESFIVKTFEEVTCLDDTKQTKVWKTVEAINID